MKNFTRLILASAISMSSAAFAMESMDESALAETTGQDGVTVEITPGTLAFSTVIHDSNGFTGATSAGAIVIGDPLAGGVLTKTSVAVGGGGAIKLDIDATADVDTGAATTPAVRIAVSVTGTGLTIHTGDISVATSNGLGVAVGTPTKFMNDMTINIGAGSLMNMYLGGEAVAGTGSHMVELNTNISTGLNIANFALIDAGGTLTGGSIQVANTKIVDFTGGTNLLVNASVDVVATGLVATVNSLGVGGANIQLTGVKLGSAAATAIGNVDIIGLNMAGTALKIYGH